jgi:hypothetical protein
MPWLKERWAKAEAAKGQKDAGSANAKAGALPGKAQDAAMRNGHLHAPSEAQNTEYAKPQPAAHSKASAEGRGKGKGKGAAALKPEGETPSKVQQAAAAMATTTESETPQCAVPRSQAEILADLESGIMNRASPERMAELRSEYLTGTVPEVAEAFLSLAWSMTF